MSAHRGSASMELTSAVGAARMTAFATKRPGSSVRVPKHFGELTEASLIGTITTAQAGT